LKPAFMLAAGAICFATAVGAFGTAFTLATKINVLPMVIYTEFTLQANVAMAAALSHSFSVRSPGLVLAIARTAAGNTVAARADEGAPAPNKRVLAAAGVHAVVCAFLVVPVFMSMLAGVTVNYFIGWRGGLTLAVGD
jgi:undecaprenyl pyrophosphate phosphatase UppP